VKTAPRKIIKECIIMVPGDGKTSIADCGSGYTRRTFQKCAAIDESLQCIHTSTERSD
jgi:replication-associated recombination protein RarA